MDGANQVVTGGATLSVAASSLRVPISAPRCSRYRSGPVAVVPVFRDVCGLAVEPDGMVFDPAPVAGAVIKEDADYSGVRVTFRGGLQNARVAMKFDVGFGDQERKSIAYANRDAALATALRDAA